MKRWIWIVVDLGQRRDASAIAVVERDWEQATVAEFKRTGRDGQWWFRVRLLERLRLGTPYPDVVRRVRDIAAMPLIAMGRTVVGGRDGSRRSSGGFDEAGRDGVLDYSDIDHGRWASVDWLERRL